MKNASAGGLGGFTLIELLVVVLIIGILAGVAVPQYETAVEKSRAAEAFVLLRAMKTGEDAFRMANGTAAVPTVNDLDFELPGEDVMRGSVPAKQTRDFILWIHSNGNPHAIRKDNKWVLGYNFSSGTFFCHSAADRYETVCKSLGGRLVSGDCNNGDGRHCYHLQ